MLAFASSDSIAPRLALLEHIARSTVLMFSGAFAVLALQRVAIALNLCAARTVIGDQAERFKRRVTIGRR